MLDPESDVARFCPAKVVVTHREEHADYTLMISRDAHLIAVVPWSRGSTYLSVIRSKGDIIFAQRFWPVYYPRIASPPETGQEDYKEALLKAREILCK